MKKVFTILMLALSLAAISQNATKVIILDSFNKDGRINYSTKVVLKSDLGKAVSATPNFESVVNDEVDAMLFNAGFQQNPRLSKDQTQQILKLSGAPYALMSEASIDEQERLTVTTKLIDLDAYEIIATESTNMSNTPNDILHGCEVLAMKMLFKVPAKETMVKKEAENPATVEKPAKPSKEEEEEINKSYDFVARQQYEQPKQQPQPQYQQQPQQYQQQPQYQQQYQEQPQYQQNPQYQQQYQQNPQYQQQYQQQPQYQQQYQQPYYQQPYQQQYFPMGGKMKRKGKNLVLNDRKLTYEEISKIFSYEDALTYKGARGNIESGNISCGTFFADLGFMVLMNTLDAINGKKPNTVLNAINGVILNITFASWIINKSIGKGRLNYLVDTYNNGQARNVQCGFTPSVFKMDAPNGNGQSLGYGGTFTISF